MAVRNTNTMNTNTISLASHRNTDINILAGKEIVWARVMPWCYLRTKREVQGEMDY